ncbi:hypothetical protein GCM10022625_13750 [Deinococcus aetherius]
MPVIGTPTVLLVTANPADQRLWIDEEMKRVQDELRTSTRQNAPQVVREDAARGEDFLRVLNRYQPQLLHFSGHRDEESRTFVDAEGSTLPLSHDRVVEAPRIAGGVRVAVFMACHSGAVAGRVVEVRGRGHRHGDGTRRRRGALVLGPLLPGARRGPERAAPRFGGRDRPP